MSQIDPRIERHFPPVDAQDLLPAFHVRHADGHLAIEPAGTQQRRVENIRTVRRGDHDDAFVGREAVHFNEQLIERLLALFVTERTAATAPSNGVELVDEDDARVVAARIFEQFADSRRAHPGIHLDEVRTACEQKRHRGFTSDRSGQQRLAGSRRPDEQHAFRNASADR